MDSLNSTSQPTFHPFSRLPFELRTMIWKEAFLGPQLLEVFVQDSIDGTLPHYPYPWPQAPVKKRTYNPGLKVVYPMFRTHGERLPHLFRINTETYELAQSSYEVCLSTFIDPLARFPPPWRGDWRSHNAHRAQVIRYHKFQELISYILPTSMNDARIQRNHAKFTAKGIYFQPMKDRLYFRDTPQSYALSTCMSNLPPSALKTENIALLAMDWRLSYGFDGAFFHFCVPHIFPTWDPSVKRVEHMMPNLRNFVLVLDQDLMATCTHLGVTYGPPAAKTRAMPKVLEGYGESGRLDVVTMFENDLPGWKAESISPVSAS